MGDLNEYNDGPLSLLTECVMNHTKILIDIEGRGNKKLIAKVSSLDQHFNMVLCDVLEEWTEKRGRALEHKERYISKMFLPGHNVRVIVKLTN